MVSRNAVVRATVGFSVAVVLSGLWRFFMEPDGEKGLWFGLVMGALALTAAALQTTRFRAVGDCLALAAALLVGGWFGYENFVKDKHELRMYLMVLASLIEVVVLATSRFGPQPGVD